MYITEDGMTLEAALRKAWGDTTVKDRYFLTPLKLEMATRRPPSDRTHDGPPPKRQKTNQFNSGAGKGGGNKGGNGGKGKGGKGGKNGKNKGQKQQPAPAGCARTTPGGKAICYGFNRQNAGCTRANCPFVHVCGVCFKEGVPMYSCSH